MDNFIPNIISYFILLLILVTCIATFGVLLNMWIDTNDSRKQNIKNTHEILFGNNIVTTLVVLISIYFIVPSGFLFFNNINTVLSSLVVEGSKSGITSIITNFIGNLTGKK